jgi:hypothetical protein
MDHVNVDVELWNCVDYGLAGTWTFKWCVVVWCVKGGSWKYKGILVIVLVHNGKLANLSASYHVAHRRWPMRLFGSFVLCSCAVIQEPYRGPIRIEIVLGLSCRNPASSIRGIDTGSIELHSSS